jgi:hypothetical protein
MCSSLDLLFVRTSDLLYCSLSKYHNEHPWGMDVNGQRYEVNYWPGDSKSGMFGGNSNWRGPICERGSERLRHAKTDGVQGSRSTLY